VACGQRALLGSYMLAGSVDSQPSAPVPTHEFSPLENFNSPLFFGTPVPSDLPLVARIIDGMLIDEWTQILLVSALEIDTGGCWKWKGNHSKKGYGFLRLTDRPIAVYRLTYQLWRGPIPKGLVSDHLCVNRGCANPWHIEIVSNIENVMRGNGVGPKNMRKTHCPKGHPYDENNTRYTSRKNGGVNRRCRTCQRKWNRDFSARLKAK
jgi:hypothetical protein